jgi:hypothetical protein
VKRTAIALLFQMASLMLLGAAYLLVHRTLRTLLRFS